MTLEKPKSITVTIGDRKNGKYESFVIYGINFEDVSSKIRRLFGNK